MAVVGFSIEGLERALELQCRVSSKLKTLLIIVVGLHDEPVGGLINSTPFNNQSVTILAQTLSVDLKLTLDDIKPPLLDSISETALNDKSSPWQ